MSIPEPPPPEPEASEGPPGSVSFVVARRPKRGREPAFEAWLSGFVQAVESSAGSQGVTVLRPGAAGGDYVLITHWRAYDDLLAWSTSPVRADQLMAAEEVSSGPGTAVEPTGMEGWFALPGETMMRAPRRWKQALVTWLVLAPLILVLGWALEPVRDRLHPVLGTYLFVGVWTLLMGFAIMPPIVRILRPWLSR
jgi:antibiotic biosynthesis monooxygenase (ABM) superfamily enzyme